MKKLLLLSIYILLGISKANAQADQLNQLIDSYENSKGVTTIKIARPMFGMLSKLEMKDTEFSELKPLLTHLNSLSIMVLERPNLSKKTESENNITLQRFENQKKEIFSSIQKLDFQELMSVKREGADIKFFSPKNSNEFIQNLVMSVHSGEEVMFIFFDGKISSEDVNKLASKIEVSEKKNERVNTSENRTVESFHSIEANSGIKVLFTQNTQKNLIVETEIPLQKQIITQVENGVLKIYFKNIENRKIKFPLAVVKITNPTLSNVLVEEGASFTSAQPIAAQTFSVEGNTGADIKLDLVIKGNTVIKTTSGASAQFNLSSDTMDLKANTGSRITLKGAAKKSELEVSSGANVNGKEMLVDTALVDISTAGNVFINATKKIEGQVHTAGILNHKNYSTNPQILIRKKSGGKINTFE